MYIALALMFVGIFVGRALRSHIKRSVQPVVMVVICLLLFVLGMELGYNDELVTKFASIGLVSSILAIFAVLGSCLAAKLLYIFISDKNEK
ncbi:MAG: LysO family transporter [Bacteroidales bacterium]|nr:LysO family transporter [Bacteroidales bacterium]